MIDFKKINDNSIIVSPANLKDSLIDLYSKTAFRKRIKFIDSNELIDNLLFTLDDKALIYLKKKLNLRYEIIEKILNNLKYVVLDEIDDEKIKELKNYYQELLDNKLIKTNSLYLNFLKNKSLYIYGYSNNDKFLFKVLDYYQINYEIYIDIDSSYSHEVYKFKDIRQEVDELFNQINDLVKKGICLNKIYLYQPSSEYLNLINKYQYYTSYKFDSLKALKLNNSPIYLKYLELLNNYNLKDSYNELYTIYHNQDNYNALNKLGRIINKIINLKLDDKNDIIELLDYYSKKVNLNNQLFENSIVLIDYNYYVKDDEYCLMVGFNHNNFPRVALDDDYLNDQKKQLLGISTSIDENAKNSELLIKFIKNTKNLYISYKEKDGNNHYYPSLLIDKLNYKVIEKDVSDNRSSEVLSKMEVASYYDILDNYGIGNDYLATYTKEELNYKEYSHEYSHIDNYYNQDVLKLSYSSIEEYNKCPFAYYLDHILKIKDDNENYAAIRGQIAHAILECSKDTDKINIDYKKAVMEKINDSKERILALNILEQIHDVVKINYDFFTASSFKKILAEEKIDLKLSDSLFITGSIDKVMIDEKHHKLIVVDYKTYDTGFKKEKAEYGVNLQLPIYAYMFKKYGKNPNSINTDVAGVYIQQIVVNRNSNDFSDYSYPLRGYTLNDPTVFSLIDKDFFNNEGTPYIQSLRINKNGTMNKNAQLGDQAFFTELENLAEEKIFEAENNIRHGNFDIKPKMFNNNEGELYCKYCNKKDICFRDYRDYDNIILSKDDEKGDEIE